MSVFLKFNEVMNFLTPVAAIRRVDHKISIAVRDIPFMELSLVTARAAGVNKVLCLMFKKH